MTQARFTPSSWLSRSSMATTHRTSRIPPWCAMLLGQLFLFIDTLALFLFYPLEKGTVDNSPRISAKTLSPCLREQAASNETVSCSQCLQVCKQLGYPKQRSKSDSKCFSGLLLLFCQAAIRNWMSPRLLWWPQLDIFRTCVFGGYGPNMASLPPGFMENSAATPPLLYLSGWMFFENTPLCLWAKKKASDRNWPKPSPRDSTLSVLLLKEDSVGHQCLGWRTFHNTCHAAKSSRRDPLLYATEFSFDAFLISWQIQWGPKSWGDFWFVCQHVSELWIRQVYLGRSGCISGFEAKVPYSLQGNRFPLRNKLKRHFHPLAGWVALTLMISRSHKCALPKGFALITCSITSFSSMPDSVFTPGQQYWQSQPFPTKTVYTSTSRILKARHLLWGTNYAKRSIWMASLFDV